MRNTLTKNDTPIPRLLLNNPIFKATRSHEKRAPGTSSWITLGDAFLLDVPQQQLTQRHADALQLILGLVQEQNWHFLELAQEDKIYEIPAKKFNAAAGYGTESQKNLDEALETLKGIEVRSTVAVTRGEWDGDYETKQEPMFALLEKRRNTYHVQLSLSLIIMMRRERFSKVPNYCLELKKSLSKALCRYYTGLGGVRKVHDHKLATIQEMAGLQEMPFNEFQKELKKSLEELKKIGFFKETKTLDRKLTVRMRD